MHAMGAKEEVKKTSTTMANREGGADERMGSRRWSADNMQS